MPGIDSLPLMLVLMESNHTVGFFVSSLYQLLSNNNFNMPNARKLPLSDVELPFVILGDEAYPLLS